MRLSLVTSICPAEPRAGRVGRSKPAAEKLTVSLVRIVVRVLAEDQDVGARELDAAEQIDVAVLLERSALRRERCRRRT